jgi:gamma-glutamyltranspeptidase / glutathione hydrolase
MDGESSVRLGHGHSNSNRTLELIAQHGSDAFYKGEIAESIINTIQTTNGTVTLEDMANYKIISRKVASATYRGVELHAVGTPANGAVCLNILKIMEQFDLEDAHDTGLTWHRWDEAQRFAYGARLELGDPSFVGHMAEMEDAMISTEKAEEIRAMIQDNETMPVEYYDPKRLYTTDSHGTSHISAADASGMAVSLTTTVNLLFGAQIMDPLSGVIM